MEKTQKVTEHRRRVNGKDVRVRSHTRRAQWARAKSTWVGAGFSAVVMLGILFEAGITLASTLLVLLIALLGALTVLASRWIEEHRRELDRQHGRAAGRTTQASRNRSSRGRSQTKRRGGTTPRSRTRSRTTSANQRRRR